MSTSTTFDVLHVNTPAMPRGSRLIADLYTMLARRMRSPARPKSRGEEAAEVRELAYSVQHTDPGFAADLFAAAARHEDLDA